MIHGITNQFLYAVTYLQCTCTNGKERKSYAGTGFFIGKGDDAFLITNRHVAEPSYRDKEYEGYKLESVTYDIRTYNEETHQVTVDYAPMYSWQLILPENKNDDVACFYDIKVKKEGSPKIYIPYEFLASKEILDSKISVCDFLAFIGFPKVYDHKNNLPILRTGTISSDPRLDYSVSSEDMGHVIAYEAFSKSGSSGSPVFALQKGFTVSGNIIAADDNFYRKIYLIGINAGCITDQVVLKHDVEYREHQHLSYMYKSDVIIDLIERASKLPAIKITVFSKKD